MFPRVLSFVHARRGHSSNALNNRQLPRSYHIARAPQFRIGHITGADVHDHPHILPDERRICSHCGALLWSGYDPLAVEGIQSSFYAVGMESWHLCLYPNHHQHSLKTPNRGYIGRKKFQRSNKSLQQRIDLFVYWYGC